MADRQTSDQKPRGPGGGGNADRVWYGLVGLCVLLVLGDLFYHKHVKFAAEDLVPGMYGFCTFLACLVLVAGARGLRRLVMRRADYYDEADDA